MKNYEEMSREECAKRLGIPAGEIRVLLNLPQTCRMYSHIVQGCTIVTDNSTNPDVVSFEPVLSFMFYRPLPTDIKYYLCIYDWTMSEHIMLMDLTRKIAIHLVHNFYGTQKPTDWGKVKLWFDTAFSMRSAFRLEHDMIEFHKVGFGKSRIFQTSISQDRLIGKPDIDSVIPDQFYKDIAIELCVSYYFGQPPLNPELIVIQKDKATGESRIIHVNSHIIFAYDYYSDLYAAMNPYKQSLYDTFIGFKVKPSSDDRELMRESFIMAANKITNDKKAMLTKVKEAMSKKLFRVSENADETFLRLIDYDPNEVFEALYPITLMHRPSLVKKPRYLKLGDSITPEPANFSNNQSENQMKKQTRDTSKNFIEGGPAWTVAKLYEAIYNNEINIIEELFDFETLHKGLAGWIPPELLEGELENFKKGFIEAMGGADIQMKENFRKDNYIIEKETIEGNQAIVVVKQYNVFVGKWQRNQEFLIKCGDKWKLYKKTKVNILE